MPAPFNETLVSWHTFYFTIAGAAAALVGLMFVALSLGQNLVTNTSTDQFNTFVTPSIVYFVSVFLVACVMMMPAHDPPVLAVILIVSALSCLLIVFPYLRRLVQTAYRQQDFVLIDWLGEVFGPPIAYILLIASGVGFIANQWDLAFTGIWLASVILVLCGIANTWSLVMWIIAQRSD